MVLRKDGGFTLIELLLVIVIISTLAVTVFVALDPVKRLKDSRDSRRTNDVQSLLTAIHSYIVDNKGALPTGMTNGMTEIQLGTGVTGCGMAIGGCNTGASCLDLSIPLAKYLKTMPVDPFGSPYTSANTAYAVNVDSNGIVTVKACGAEGGSNIYSSR